MEASPVKERQVHELEPFLPPSDDIESVRDPFHRNRWMCVTDPEQAVLTLGASARLELFVVRARDLMEIDIKNSSGSCDFEVKYPYVQVLVDEVVVAESEVSDDTHEPEWNFFASLGITAGFSMIRVQVVGRDKFLADEDVGFLELCVGDMPFDEFIEGWFEIRMQSKLRGRSTDRYAAHCTARDECTDAGEAEQYLHSEELSFWKTRPPLSHTPQSHTLELEEDAAYGGEIHLRMRLLRIGSWSDTLYSLALPPPVHDFGVVGPDDKSNWVMQDLFDDAQDIWSYGYDMALVSIMNLIKYILGWRSCIFSFVVATAFLAALFFTFLDRHLSLVFSIVLGLAALLMILMAFEPLRIQMTVGGGNAPLNREGLALAAAWSDTEQMQCFLERMVDTMNGAVTQPQELRSFASRCYNRGQPCISWEALCEALKAAEWLTFDDHKLVFGTLVLVDYLYRAKVISTDGDLVDIAYADVAHGFERREWVDRFRILVRQPVYSLPEHAIPVGLKSPVRRIILTFAKYRYPFCNLCIAMSDLIAWRRCRRSLAITLILGGASSGLAWVYYSRSQLGRTVEQAGFFAVKILLSAAGGGVVVGKAWWMAPFRRLALAAYRMVTLRRGAPYVWAFWGPLEPESPMDSAEREGDCK